MEKQIIQLQETLAHHAVEIAQLSDELYAQQKETAQLREQVRRLSEQLKSSLREESHDQPNTPEPPPPHY